MNKKDKNYFPKKGDRVKCGKEFGTILDDDFNEVQWDNGDIEEWSGLFGSFQDIGGFVIDLNENN